MRLVTNNREHLTLRLPVLRHQGGVIVLVVHGWELGEDVPKVFVWIDAEPLAGDQHRVNDGATSSGLGRADKKPVFLAYGGGTDGVLDQVVVDLSFAVFKQGLDQWPLGKGVCGGLSQFAFGESLVAADAGEPMQPGEQDGQFGFAEPGAFFRAESGFTVERFPAVNTGEDTQGQSRLTRMLFQTVEPLSPDMGHAADPHEVFVRFGQSVVGLIAIGLECAGKTAQQRDQKEILRLTRLIGALRQKLFGTGQGEKVDHAQLQIQLGLAEAELTSLHTQTRDREDEQIDELVEATSRPQNEPEAISELTPKNWSKRHQSAERG